MTGDFKSRVALEDQIKKKSEQFYKLKSEHSHLIVEAEEALKRRDDMSGLLVQKKKETETTEQLLTQELADLKTRIDDTMLAR